MSFKDKLNKLKKSIGKGAGIAAEAITLKKVLGGSSYGNIPK